MYSLKTELRPTDGPYKPETMGGQMSKTMCLASFPTEVHQTVHKRKEYTGWVDRWFLDVLSSILCCVSSGHHTRCRCYCLVVLFRIWEVPGMTPWPNHFLRVSVLLCSLYILVVTSINYLLSLAASLPQCQLLPTSIYDSIGLLEIK
jgi:hypothetical protein